MIIKLKRIKLRLWMSEWWCNYPSVRDCNTTAWKGEKWRDIIIILNYFNYKAHTGPVRDSGRLSCRHLLLESGQHQLQR